MVILVTGGSGQLGQAILSISPQYEGLRFYFADSAEGDITDVVRLRALFSKVNPSYCINAAAYTAVDKAESEPEKAFGINVLGAKNIAQVCLENDCTLLHVSTDFVFDGKKTTPYTENDHTHPQGIYGQTKRDGELEISRILPAHFVIRTSWVYSEFGHNFMKTMLRLASEREELQVVDDQIGTPTYAVDLAHALVQIVLSRKTQYGIYHYSNEGTASWYDFAREIFEVNKIDIRLVPIPSSSFPTPAARPKFSVLDKSKIKAVFGLQIRRWETALREI